MLTNRRCAICRKAARWEGRRSKRLPWEPLCVGCAANQGERLMVRLHDRTRPGRNRAFLSRHPGYQREYRELHKEHIRELQRRWHERHREGQLQRMREYYAANRDKWKTVYARKKAT